MHRCGGGQIFEIKGNSRRYFWFIPLAGTLAMQHGDFFRTTALLLVLSTCLRAAEPDERSVHIPATISKEAQEYLKSLPTWEERLAAMKPLNTLEDWEAAQEAAEQPWEDVNIRTKRELVADVKITKIGGAAVHILTPKNYNTDNDDKALLYIHGGAYVFGSAEGSLFLSAPIAAYTGLKIYSVDYRLAPQRPFPAAVDECVTVYREMLKEFSPKNIGVYGHSAGGSLLLAMLLKAADPHDLPMPAAVASLTPWSDIAKIGDSYFSLEGTAPILHYDHLAPLAKAYVGGADMKDPLVSPVYARYSSEFPPTFIQTGTRDLFLSNCARLHQTMKRAGVDVELSVHEGMWHGFQGIPHPFFPEAIAANKETAEFFAARLELK